MELDADCAAPLVVIPQHFGCLVFDRRTSRYLPFDAEATQLLLQLRQDPIDAVLRQTSGSGRQEQIARFFEQFYERGFFTLQGKLAANVLELEVPKDHLSGPLALHLEVVAACNLSCAHCFAGTLPRRELPLTLAELDRLFGEMAALGTFRLGLTGGEPLLRKDLLEVIDLALEHGLCPCLTSNGLLLTEDWAREFGKRELVWLNVSLEGATAETNDPIRGAGTFDRVLERLELLRRHTRFTLAFTLLQTNVAEVEACAELARRVGAHTAVFRPLYPVGTAGQHLELMPTFAQYNDALNRLAELSEPGGGGLEFRPIDPFSPQLRREAQSVVHQNFGCGAGNLVCSVSVSGDVNPCSFLGPAFVAANVREQSLAEIWHHSQTFQTIRCLSINEPSVSGGERTVFGGGCRARALVLNGSINAPDPWISEQVAGSRFTDSHQRVFSPLRVLDLSAPPQRPAAEESCP